jgi:uncharacterized protein YigE (DUF2233 family)
MNRNKKFAGLIFIALLFIMPVLLGKIKQPAGDRFISFIADSRKQRVVFYWKDKNGNRFGSIDNLRRSIEGSGRRLLFATNGGMFTPLFAPKGLYIENQTMLTPLDTASGEGNFYLKPNGIFYITGERRAVICNTKSFQNNSGIMFATQSGPMLIDNGQIHPAFKQGSTNLNIRNGVGILPDGKVAFAISKVPVNFYDLANYFKSMGCSEALYLDGFVSRMYLPEKNRIPDDGDFGVIIGVTDK